MTSLVIKIQHNSILKRFTFSAQNFSLDDVKQACKRRFTIQSEEINLEYDDLFQQKRLTIQTTEQLQSAVLLQQIKKLFISKNEQELSLYDLLLPVIQDSSVQNLLKQQIQNLQQKGAIVLKNRQPQELAELVEKVISEVQEENQKWKPDSSFLSLTQYENYKDINQQDFQIL